MKKAATFSDLRNNAKLYFDAVEQGASIEVYRHGKLIALITPAYTKAGNRWKSGKPLKVDGLSLSAAILDERRF